MYHLFSVMALFQLIKFTPLNYGRKTYSYRMISAMFHSPPTSISLTWRHHSSLENVPTTVLSFNSFHRLFCSHVDTHHHNTHNHSTIDKIKATANEREAFHAVYPDIVESVLDAELESSLEDDVRSRFKRVLDSNVPHGKLVRGRLVVNAYKHLCGNQPTVENLHLARVLGWCVEFLHSHLLITDDIMDQSVTRRGQACWYKNEDVGLLAINDAAFVECAMFSCLRIFFKQYAYYGKLLESINNAKFKTIIGQHLDAAAQQKAKSLCCSLDDVNLIAKFKTSHYSFCLPVNLALIMTGIEDERVYQSAEQILLKIGNLFQTQDDYIDCFGDPKTTGKIGTDIEDGKCSWLLAMALQTATATQLHTLKSVYGQSEPSKVKMVHQIYSRLGLQKMYQDYENQMIGEIHADIMALDSLPKDIFNEILRKISYRKA